MGYDRPRNNEHHMTMTPSAWEPLCDGRQAEELQRTAIELARDLRTVSLDEPSVSGEGGLAILYHYADRVFPGRGFDEDRQARTDRMVDLVANNAATAALFGGFVGAAWSIEHIQPTDPTANGDDDPNGDIDEVLIELLTRDPWPGEYDLISGLVGFALYALERGPRPRARECLRLIVDQLGKLARPDRGGLAWISPRQPDVLNLGVAHGVPGVIAVLAAICTIPELADRARPLLDGAVAWLLEHRLAPGSGGAFSYQAGSDRPARSAWCYGDPGIAVTLLAAARHTRTEAWERVALEVGLRALDRPLADTQAEDPAFCHGTAGLAHIYNRLYQATGEQAFAEAARTWLARTLDLRRPGVGLSGYLSLIPTPTAQEPGRREWLPDPCLLTGVAGIALVLLAASTSVEPAWDRALLCELAPGFGRLASGFVQTRQD
jgi:hypothetical protein